jgi:hypothetical protein
LPLLGNDGKFDLTLLDVENGVAGVSLREDDLILPIFCYCISFAYLSEKYLGIKRGFGSLLQGESLFIPIKAPLSDEGVRSGDCGFSDAMDPFSR